MKSNPGVVSGTVQELDMANARVKVKFEWLHETYLSNWAPVAMPMSGKKRGMFFMPEIDDQVLVAFEQGDFEFPRVVGFLWNGVDLPPESTNKNRVIVTPGGHTLRFEDTDGAKRIILKSSDNNQVVIDDQEQTITVNTRGMQTIVLNGKDGGSITLQGGGRILEMKNGTVQIT